MCISATHKDKDANSIMLAANNLDISLQSPDKIINEADKLKILINLP